MKINTLYDFLILIFVCTFFCFCKNEPKTNVAKASVNPFDTTAMSAQSLTEEDRAKLAMAIGKTVKNIKIEELIDKFSNAKNKLHLFCLWNINESASVATLKSINSLAETFDSTRLMISAVHISDKPNTEGLNLFVREHQLTIDAFALDNTTVDAFMKKINKELSDDAKLPIIFMIDKSNDTYMMYNRSLDEKELLAILQPLVL
jgi:hypothetical protein